jgi:signal transduction histidine kinase
MSTNPNPLKPLPWWTWIAPLVIIEAGDQFSLLFFQDAITSSFYLPASLGLILVFWWGPARVLPATFLVSSLNNYFYGFSSYWVWLGFGIGDSLSVALAWLLVVKVVHGKFWLPDTRHTVAFIVFGLAIPIFCYAVNWQLMYVTDHVFGWNEFWPHLRRDLLGESIVNIIIVIPTLFFLTPPLSRLGVIQVAPIPRTAFSYLTRAQAVESVFIAALVIVLVVLFRFQDVWFIFGTISLYIAIRFGFDAVLVANVVIFVASYLIPSINHPEFVSTLAGEGNYQTFFGYLLLFLFSAMTGRVIADLRNVKEQLSQKNLELQQTNVELDRFVYSASHDMSAPLKSIRGLVNVGRLTHPTGEQRDYLNKIETSAIKLEAFIQDVLNYSRNKRTELKAEEVNVGHILEEIFNGLRHLGEVNAPTLVLEDSTNRTLVTDPARLKIILNNIVSNALKYQKKDAGHQPLIRAFVTEENNVLRIHIDDNGEGIAEEMQPEIFKMFYRGNMKSEGSGLGLYIALEAALKLGGKISLYSELGKGSVFTIELPHVQSRKTLAE